MKNIKLKKLVLICTIIFAGFMATAAVAGGIKAAAQPAASPTPEAEPEPSSPQPSLTPSPEPVDESIWDEGIVNILFIGTDEIYGENDRGRGDVTLLCSLNRDDGSVKLISFERSIGMPWPEHGDVMLTNTYAYGGAELMCQDIERCFKVDIDSYVQMDFGGFCGIIDALGGVEMYLSAQEAQALTEDLYYEQSFTEGDNHLNGLAALRYCRLRRIDDNWHRVERQRNMVQAVINRAKQLRIGQIKELAKLAAEHVSTDIPKAQLAALIISAPRFLRTEPQQMTIPDRNNVWTYDSGQETVTGCDFGSESKRLREFIYGAEAVETMALGN